MREGVGKLETLPLGIWEVKVTNDEQSCTVVFF